jgi:hypothetical protein
MANATTGRKHLVRTRTLAKCEPAWSHAESYGHALGGIDTGNDLARLGIAPRLDTDASSGGQRAHGKAGALAGLLEAGGEAFMQSAEDSVLVLWNRIYRLYKRPTVSFTEGLASFVPVREPARWNAESSRDSFERV